MGDQQMEDVRELVENFDELWSRDPRAWRIKDIPLGERGVPQRALAYVAGAVIVVVVLNALPLVGSLISWWMVVPAAALAFAAVHLRVGGLHAHQAVLPAVQHVLRPSMLLGWEAMRVSEGTWQLGELASTPDGSDGRFPEAVFTGPGQLIRFVDAEVTSSCPPRLARRLGAGTTLTYRQRHAAPVDPRIVHVGAGERVILRAE